MISVELIPAFADNYIFLIVDSATKKAIVVDPGEAAPVRHILDSKNLQLSGILATHHHADHIGGVPELRQLYRVPVWAPLKNKAQISADFYLSEGNAIKIGEYKIRILGLPGHTLGHIAFWFSEQSWLFSGDVLFGLGCGRLFEGDFAQAFDSLQIIKELPDKTLVFCAHEYTERNLQFCKTLPPESFSTSLHDYEENLKQLRSAGLPSVPLHLSEEKKCNPFLLASTKEEFAVTRELRNRF